MTTRPARTRLAVLAAAVLVLSALVTAAAASAAVCPTVAADGTVSPKPAPLVDWSGCDLTGAALAGAQLDVADLTGAVLSGATLTAANLTGARLAGAVLVGAKAGHAVLRQADLTGADLSSADLGSVSWNGATLSGTVMAGATLDHAVSLDIAGSPASLPAGWHLVRGFLLGRGAAVTLADLSGLDLAGYDLSQAVLSRVDLTGASLSGADLSGAHLDQVDVEGLDVATATLTRLDARRLVGVPAPLPTGWVVRAGHLVGPTALITGSFAGVDLSGLDLSHASLSNVALTGLSLVGTDLSAAGMYFVSSKNVTADPATVLPSGWSVTAGYLVGPGAQLQYALLHGVDLTGRNLTGAAFGSADLSAATLDGATLTAVDFSGAYASGASLDGADLSGSWLPSVDLSFASLRGARLAGITLASTSFSRAVLTGATGLSTVADDPGTTWELATCPDGRPWNQHVSNRCTLPVDTTAPQVSMPAAAEFQYPPASGDEVMRFAVTATDAAAGELSVRLRTRVGTAGGTTMSAYRTGAWSLRAHGTLDERLPLVLGARLCVQAQAKDPAGNLSGWTAERCSTSVTDDIALGRSTRWTESFTPGWYHASVARSASHGAYLAGLIRDVRRIGVLASTCSTCGSIALYVGSRKVGSLSLRSTTARSRVLLMLPRLPSRLHGDLRVVVTSPSGRMVRIDGVAISAY